MTEILLSALHITLILAWTSFIASQAALCHPEWLNAAVIARLIRLNHLATVCAVLLLGSGLARVVWGVKTWFFYVLQWGLYVKVAVFLVVLLMGYIPLRRYHVWQKGWDSDSVLPSIHEQYHARRWLMWQSHLLMVLIVLGACLARGVF